MRRLALVIALPLALSACDGLSGPGMSNQERYKRLMERQKREADAAEALRNAQAAQPAPAQPSGGTPQRGGSSMDPAPAPGTPQIHVDSGAGGAVPPPAPAPTPAPAADAPPARHPC